MVWKPDDWKPQDSLKVILSDETSAPRTKEEFDQMVEDLRQAVSRYGFDLQSLGCNNEMEAHELVRLVRRVANEYGFDLVPLSPSFEAEADQGLDDIKIYGSEKFRVYDSLEQYAKENPS